MNATRIIPRSRKYYDARAILEEYLQTTNQVLTHTHHYRTIILAQERIEGKLYTVTG